MQVKVLTFQYHGVTMIDGVYSSNVTDEDLVQSIEDNFGPYRWREYNYEIHNEDFRLEAF